MMKRWLGFTLMGAGLMAGPGAWAQQTPLNPPQPPKPLFASHDVLELTLEAPLRRVFRERSQDPEEYPAVLSYDAGGGRVTVDLEISTRGRFRLQRNICNFPPLWLDFPKDSVAGTLFAGQNRVKLVTHCQSGRQQYEQYVLQEYLIYRTFNLLTDLSFRVRLARITYVENEEERDPLTRFAFLIEHKDDLASRTGWQILEIPLVPPDAFDQDNLNTAAVFQFMIGNTDMAFFQADRGESECCHNAIALGTMAGPVFSVPYDFDMSGIINTRYAVVDPRFDQRSVTQRRFRGRCVSPDLMNRTLQRFRDKRDAIYALYREQPDLDEGVLERSLDYLDGFYEIINDEGKTERDILRDCRRL
jgi:hypothetical protein